jgi:ribosomal protein S18 acetylase RimI-like enzyme
VIKSAAVSIRPINLPADLDAWIAVTAAGFQYPDNPKWNYSPEEIENNVAGIRSLKKIWPLFALLRTFSADARDLIRGFFYEEDSKVVGNISCQRRGEAWYISDVVVLPEHRGKGYARKLVETCVEDIRARGGRQVSLDVISGNVPAVELYRSAGFREYTSLAFYEMKGYHPLLAVGTDDCRVEEIKGDSWKLRYEFWRRVTPAGVQEFAPVTESSFRRSAFTRAFNSLWRWMSGEKFQVFALLRGRGRHVLGVAAVTRRTKEGGINTLEIGLDETYSGKAEYFLTEILWRIYSDHKTPLTEFELPAWQTGLRKACSGLGVEPKYETISMGIKLE